MEAENIYWPLKAKKFVGENSGNFPVCLTFAGLCLNRSQAANPKMPYKYPSEDGNLIIDGAALMVVSRVHSGVILGRTKYGQFMIHSKLGINEPVTTQTGVSLNKYFRARKQYSNEHTGNAWFY